MLEAISAVNRVAEFLCLAYKSLKRGYHRPQRYVNFKMVAGFLSSQQETVSRMPWWAMSHNLPKRRPTLRETLATFNVPEHGHGEKR